MDAHVCTCGFSLDGGNPRYIEAGVSASGAAGAGAGHGNAVQTRTAMYVGMPTRRVHAGQQTRLYIGVPRSRQHWQMSRVLDQHAEKLEVPTIN